MSLPAPRPSLWRLLFADGWSVRWRAMLGGGLIALMMAFATLELMVTSPEFLAMSALITTGGLIGGTVMCGWIGHSGTWGAWLSAAGCYLAGVVGAIVAGSALMPGFGTVAGAFLGLSLPLRSFGSFVIWAACCIVLHKVLSKARANTCAGEAS